MNRDRESSGRGIQGIPKEIVEKLEALRRRIRSVMVLRGVLAVVAAALFALLAAMAIDALLVLTSPILRWLLSLSVLAFVLHVAWRHLIRPLTRPLSLTAMARAVEARHPEIEERISTSVELLSDGDGARTASSELLARVAELATGDVSALLPEREITTRSARRLQWAAGAAGFVMLVVFAIWPRESGQLIARTLAPFADIGTAHSGAIRHVTGDLVVARGDAVEIEIEFTDVRARAAEITTRTEGASGETTERMERVATLPADAASGPTQRFRFLIPSAQTGFSYRIRSGRLISNGYTIQVVDRPRIESLEIEYSYPKYTGLLDHADRPASGPIEAPAGTGVTVRAGLNRPVSQAALDVAGEAVPALAGDAEEVSGDGSSVEWRFTLRDGTDGFWKAEFTDPHGIKGASGEQPVRSVPDRAPAVTIVAPVQRELELRPTEDLPVSFRVNEDYGLVSVDWVASRDPGGPFEQAVGLPLRTADDLFRWEGAATVALSDLGLGSSGSVTMRLRVRDTRPAESGGPQEAFSEEIRIRLNRDAPTLMEQVVAAQEESLQDGLQEAMRELNEAGWRAEEVARETEREDRLGEQAMERLSEIQEAADAAARRLEELAREMAEGAFARNAENMRQTAAEPMEEAARQAGDLPLQESAEDRREMAQAMAENVRNAREGVEDAIESLRQDRPRLRELGRLDALAQEQRALAREAEAATPGSPPQDENPPETGETASAAAAATDPDSPPPPETPAEMTLEERQDWQNRQDRLANEIRETSDTFAPRIADAGQLLEQAAQARQLADEARNLAEGESLVAEALAPGTPSEPSPSDGLLSALRDEQSAIAAETSAMEEAASAATTSADEGSTGNPESPSPALAAASKAAESAAADLSAGEIERARTLANEAAEQLAEASRAAESVAGTPSPESAADPDSPGLSNAGSGDSPAGSDESSPSTADSAVPRPDPGASSPADSDPSPTPATPPTAEGIAALAQRQERVAEMLESLASTSSPTEAAPGTLAEAQAGIADSAMDVAARAEAVSEASMNTPSVPSSFSQSVASAARELNQASAAAGSAAETLGEAAAQAQAQGQADGPRAAHRDASSAAEGFQSAAEWLGAAADSLEAQGQALQEQGNALSEAVEQAASAAQSAAPSRTAGQGSSPPGMAQAAQQASASAEALQNAAAAALAAMGVPSGFPASSMPQMASNAPGQAGPRGAQQPGGRQGAPVPGSEGSEPSRGGPQPTNPMFTVPPELARLGISAEDWARIRGTARSGIGTAGGQGVPPEYRDLAKGYFEALSRESARQDESSNQGSENGR